MTVMSLQWLVARPRRRAAVIRRLSSARRERRTYWDSFFADPAVVEDDSLRMSRRGAAG
jgi:hypothetical protein